MPFFSFSVSIKFLQLARIEGQYNGVWCLAIHIGGRWDNQQTKLTRLYWTVCPLDPAAEYICIHQTTTIPFMLNNLLFIYSTIHYIIYVFVCSNTKKRKVLLHIFHKNENAEFPLPWTLQWHKIQVLAFWEKKHMLYQILHMIFTVKD